ncbi:bacC, partial [Symbiodinium necroappetens]
MKVMGKLAEFLGLDADVVSKEMKALDFDANNLVSFAEFVLWADKHTIGIPLGIAIPDKREWRKGMPAHWTTIPPPSPEEEAALKASTAGVAVGKAKKAKAKKASVPEDPDTTELEDFIAAAKDAEWEKVWEILERHPGYVNMRPPYRRYSAIHQACFHGEADVVRKFVEEWKADPLLKTKDSETPEDVVCAPELRCIILAFGRHYSEAGETSPANAACKEADDTKTKTRFAGKRVLVTGGANGIGRQIAEAGPIDILINNVCVQLEASCHEHSLEDWNKTLAIGLTSYFLFSKLCLPHMLEKGCGAIINIASVQGSQSQQRIPAYAAVKGGVLSLTRQLGVEYASKGVRVNSVSPGTIATPLVAGILERAGTTREAAGQAYPMRRIGEPNEVAKVVLFLASDDASFITAENITVDGGITSLGGMAELYSEAQENGNDEVVTYLQEKQSEEAESDEDEEDDEPPLKMMRGGGCELDPEALMEKANEAIEHAKWQQWDEMLAIFESYPGCQNMRPEYRRFAAIHQAAYAGDAKILKKMVDCGANPGLLTRDKETPLQIAEAEGNSDAAAFLESLEVSAESAALIQEAHKVIDAAKEGKWDKTFELLEACKNPDQVVNCRPSVRQYGVLHQAAFHGDIEVLRRLLEDFKANVKLLTKDGQSALQIAQNGSQEAAAKYLEACVPSIQLEDDFVKYPEQ